MPDFLPRADASLLSFATSFDRQINADPAAFGLPAASAAGLTPLVTAFAHALAIAQQPATRTTGATAAKNDARALLKSRLRELNSRIRHHSTVTEQQRLELGCKPLNAGRRRAVPMAAGAPHVEVVVHSHGSMTLRLMADTPSRREYPAGTTGAIVLMAVEDPATASVGHWQFVCVTTRSRPQVAYPTTLPPGTRVWVRASWLDTRRQPVAFSSAVGIIVGGMTVRAA